MTTHLTRIALIAITAAIPLLTATPAAAQPPPGTSCVLFPADNVLNTDVSTLPVNSMSSAWMSNMTQHSTLHPDLGTFAQWYGMPLNVAPPPTSGVTPTFAYDAESDHPAEGYPFDQATLIEGGPSAPSGSDRHALVVNKASCKLYEAFHLQNFTNGQTPSAGSGAVWDLGSDAMRPQGWTSADAAGLPITPLLLRPDEILAGSIAHAIRFTAHCTHGYVWPASHDAGLCGAGFPPMGARFRLRSGFDVSGYSPATQVVLRAFQRYGLILADNGSDWYFSGTTDDWWGTTAGSQVVSELKSIPAGQFDAVDESALQAAPDSYQATPETALAGAAAITAPAANRLDVVTVGRDRQVWHRSWDGTAWSAWEAEGGVVTADPGTASWASGRLDVFVRGADNALWHRSLDAGVWAQWESLGGVLHGGPAATTWGPGRLDVVVVGADGGLWHRSWSSAGWGGWESLGGVLTSDPGTATMGSNTLDVVGRGADNALWHRSWNGSTWGPWQSLGGNLTSAAGAASSGANSLEVYCRGADGQLWQRAWDGARWSDWQPLGGVLTSSPGAASWGTGRLDVFVRGADLQGWHRWRDGTGWSAWERVLGPPAG